MKILAIIIGFSFSMGAFAKAHFVCKNEDCLKYGWVMTDEMGSGKVDATCNSSDCAHFGWEEVSQLFGDKSVSCLRGDCYRYGYDVTQVSNGKPFMQVRCKGNDCLTNGWTQARGPFLKMEIECNEGSCFEQGWTANMNGRAIHKIWCKRGDCFKFGWTQEP